MMWQRRIAGDYNAALELGEEALTIVHTLGDRSIEAVATWFLGDMHLARAEYSEAAKLFERNIGLEGKLRAERFGTTLIQSAASEYSLGLALAQLGRFDEAVGHAEAAVRIVEDTDHPWTLFMGLLHLGFVHLGCGDFARAVRVLERCLHLGRTWQFVDRTPYAAAALSVAYALAGRIEESLALVAGAVKEFRATPTHILFSAGRTYLAAGRIDEATSYAREALALCVDSVLEEGRPKPSP